MSIPTVRAMRDLQPSISVLERLLAAGLISELQLKAALREKQNRDESISQTLVRLGLISERLLRETLDVLLGNVEIDLGAALPDRDAIAIVPRDVANRYCVFPISFDATAHLLTIAATGGFDVATADELAAVLDTGIDIQMRLSEEAEIRSAIRKHYCHELSLPGILRELDSDESDRLSRDCKVNAHAQPLSRLVNAILVDAVKRGASVIHLEPEYGFLRVRYRIDGVLRQTMALHHSYWPGMAAWLDTLSVSNSTEPDASRNEKFSLLVGTRRVEFRIHRCETMHGENHIVRVLKHNSESVPLENLGLESGALESLRLMLARPAGLIVVAGPPDSGKATSLYSMLGYRSDESICIMALQDRVKYRLARILQVPVDSADNASHAAGVRSMLEQDAEVIVVGELRDKESIDSAMRGAVSGRQLLATISTSSALDAVSFLLSMGVAPRILASGIIGIVAQRLVRKLCRNCRQPYVPDKSERELIGENTADPIRLYREDGCEECAFLGYKGRTGVFEVLRFSGELRDAIACNATQREIQEAARNAGFIDVADHAIRLVIAGVTSLSEVSRVVDLTSRLK